MKGEVKWYNIKHGYGFIRCDNGEEVFIHKSQIPFWSIFLNKGDKVDFIKKDTKRGLQAYDIKIL